MAGKGLRGLRRLAVALGAFALTVGLGGCGGRASAYDVSSIGPKIHVGVLADQPGLGFVRSGNRSGLDLDVARYLVHELGFVPSQIVWHDVLPSDREEVLEAGQVDMVVAAYSITSARQEQVDFAGPYFVAAQDLLVRKADSHLGGVQDLRDRKVCVLSGSTSEQAISNQAPQARIQERERIGACVTALLSGQADAVSGDDIALAGASSVMGGGQLTLAGARLGAENYGVAVRRGQPELVAAIDKALNKMHSDGSWGRAVRSAASAIDYHVDLTASDPWRAGSAAPRSNR
ncbi:solute binding protein of ABC transporter [Bifidobacterium actinocoloniiforme DSM 22766]|uniref:Solute binding protein of ABC transporter n=1 Tax=Bifidobacterium actinocoloniiforme DSM 22766 TaxID=1437605 RepID=A0A086Z0A5_9BIFI|nr:transporter substrate-binding domain-containing protein [Bifidobacterium actinocoloniiforme]AKV55207.1 hypothetical protein AB656_01900 [Bifidobacterium actinocoloniiforme DSM 22766]KFI39955.1 solute binding protein of ABC transporter [Bifidobacterium actinocoloniiforme DSM 22766]